MQVQSPSIQLSVGVVYCEFQGKENHMNIIVDRRFMRNLCFDLIRLKELLFPGDCPFKYETGGIMANIRTLNATKSRLFFTVSSPQFVNTIKIFIDLTICF